MSTHADVVQMAGYNAWMNAKLYESAAKLTPAALAEDRGAFFGSLLGTLNHLVVGDTIWLQRFAKHPAAHASLDPVRALEPPTALDQVLFDSLEPLRERRQLLDGAINRWAAELSDADLQHVFEYKNMRGIASRKRFASLVTHFFNHQTHHRGQATTLLFQAGQDVGVTDLLALISNEPDA